MPEERVPPGQHLTKAFPVLHEGQVPCYDMEHWRLRIFGLVERPLTLTWDELLAYQQESVHCDIHCVTGWSKLDTCWTGVPPSRLLDDCGVEPAAKHVLVHAYGGYTANFPLADLLQKEVLLAFRHDGQELEPNHGGPLRLLVPQLYLWKSAKWIEGLEILAEVTAGYWEQRGYNLHGDPWRQERFRHDPKWEEEQKNK